MNRITPFIVLLGALLAATLHAETPLSGEPAPPAAAPPVDRATILARALADFDEGVALSESDPQRSSEKLRAAIQGFEIMAASAANGALYYNLGNAYLRLNEIGRAIANYRRAEKLMPGDANLAANLNFALAQRRNRIEATGGRTVLATLFFWHYRLPLHTRFGVALGLYVLFWAVLIVKPFVRQIGLKLFAAALAVGWITFGASVATSTFVESRSREGVITADDVVVRKGNGENYDPEFKQALHDGVEFSVREERGGWLKIELPDGNSGWIRRDQAVII